MKKNTIILLSIIAFFVMLFFAGISGYNGLVSAEEEVNSQWANVESQYQRRADLIQNLVETVKGYATHEKSTLVDVTSARSKATQVTIDPTKLTAAKLQEFQAAQGQLSAALGKLVMIKETYPELKANQNFLDLQNHIERTENRIAVERGRFNELAKEFNASIRKFPRSIIASIGNFEKKPYFEAEKGSEKAPKVKF